MGKVDTCGPKNDKNMVSMQIEKSFFLECPLSSKKSDVQ